MVIRSRAAYRRGELHTKISVSGFHNGSKTLAAVYVPGSVPDEKVKEHLKKKGLDHLEVKSVREVYLRNPAPQAQTSILGTSAGKMGGHAGHGQTGVGGRRE